MRQFVVLGHDVPTDPSFSLDDLAGGAGRLDILCRCVNSAVFLSHGIRSAVRIHLVLDDTLTVRFDGETLRHLHPDERSIGSRIKEALANKRDAIGHQPAEPSPGVELYRMDTATTIDHLVDKGTLVHLHETGDPISEGAVPDDPIFVLSDHHAFTDAEMDLLADRADRQVRVGPKAIHADHTITVVHNYLDTDGYRAY